MSGARLIDCANFRFLFSGLLARTSESFFFRGESSRGNVWHPRLAVFFSLMFDIEAALEEAALKYVLLTGFTIT